MDNFSLMILAAGFGARMKKLTEHTPKPLLRIKNKTLLGNTIDFFEKLGCNKFIINTHYLHKQLDDFIKKNYSNKKIILIFEPNILDTGGGIKNAIKYFNKKNFLATNVDILWNEHNLKDIINFINQIKKVKNCSLLLSKRTNTMGIDREYGDFAFEKDNLRRWKNNDPIIFYSGLQILNPKIFENINLEKFSLNYIWDQLINKKKLEGHIMKSKLSHLGDLATYEKINSSLTLD